MFVTQFQGFQGGLWPCPHGPSSHCVGGSPWVLEYPPAQKKCAATTLVPMGARVPTLSPKDDPTPSQSLQNGFGKGRFLEDLDFKCYRAAQKLV